MHIVCTGSGVLVRHLAAILVKEGHRLTLIDQDKKVLEELSATSENISVCQGSITDLKILEEILEFSPDIFIALTNNDNINLAACMIAKNLNYPRTIAHLSDDSYLNSTRLDFQRIFEVDHFISPEIFVAHDILKRISNPGAIAVENFTHGALQLCTVLIPDTWQQRTIPLKDLELPKQLIVGLIRRIIADPTYEQLNQRQTIFPHGDDKILAGDEVTFIGATEAMPQIYDFFKIPQKKIKTVVIIGGSLIGFYLAKLLHQINIDVRIIEKDYQRCIFLAEQLPDTTIMNHDGTDLEFLTIEKVGHADLLIACTNHDEVNLFVSLLGRLVGCNQSHLILNNAAYIPIASWLGFRHVTSPTMIATNEILAQLFSGKVTSLISLYENQAEIMEIKVSEHSKVVGIPLYELGSVLPKDLLILMIQNRGRSMIANGNRIISPADTVILVTSPKHVHELESIF